MGLISPHTAYQTGFDSQWKVEEMPACDEGMALLRQFAIAQPEAFAFVQPCDFEQLDNSAFAGIAEWEALAEHSHGCDKCNKV